MILKNFMRGVLCATFSAVCLLAFGGSDKMPEDSNRADYEFQLTTVNNIRTLALGVETFRQDHGSPPDSLETLFDGELYFKDTQDARSILVDEWGTPLVYYTNGSIFVILSLGKNGKPDSQSTCGGCPVPIFDPDADIVWIGKNWAQTPHDISQY